MGLSTDDGDDPRIFDDLVGTPEQQHEIRVLKDNIMQQDIEIENMALEIAQLEQEMNQIQHENTMKQVNENEDAAQDLPPGSNIIPERLQMDDSAPIDDDPQVPEGADANNDDASEVDQKASEDRQVPTEQEE